METPRSPGVLAGPWSADWEASLPLEFRSAYRLQRRLGQGATAIVHAAVRCADGRPVAIKFLTRIQAENGFTRFQREIRFLQSITHPNVVAVLDDGEVQGYPYLVSELMEGGSLKQYLRQRETCSVGEALALISDCLEGLSACHAQGLVHRDLKPDNILLTASGRAKLADLGIAKTCENLTPLTAEMAVIGTPLYMAPEQLRGEVATAQTDLYACGLILYELLTGETKWRELRGGRRVPAPLPEIGSVCAGLPPAVRATLERALAPLPADRFASAREMLTALRAPVASRADTLVMRRPGRRARRLGVAGLVAVALFFGLKAARWARLQQLQIALKSAGDAQNFAELERVCQSVLWLDPQCPRARVHFAWAREKLGGAAEALKLYNELARDHPKSAEFWSHVGNVHLTQRNYPEAQRHLRFAISLDTRYIWPVFLLGMCLKGEGKVDQVKEIRQQLMRMQAEGLESQAEFFRQMRALEQYDLAETLARETLVRNPTDDAARLALADCLTKQDKLVQAAEVLDGFDRDTVPVATVRLYNSARLIQMGPKSTFQAQLKRMVRNPPTDALCRLVLSDQLRQTGELATAESFCSGPAADEESPVWAEAVHRLAEVRFLAGRDAEADELYERLLKKRAQYADAYATWSSQLAKRGQLEKAAATLTRGFAALPGRELAVVPLAQFLGVMKRRDLGEQLLRTAIRSVTQPSPYLAHVHFFLAEFLIAGRSVPEAELHLRAALRIAPTSAPVAGRLAIVLKIQNRFQEAAQYAKLAAELDPKADGPHTTLGQIYMTQLRGDEAAKEFAQADALRHAGAKGKGR
jgi:tetratricopeptide (TPR) repeat protein/tRNA A-37 threonylcarbamoyl transferase component Bud32